MKHNHYPIAQIRRHRPAGWLSAIVAIACLGAATRATASLLVFTDSPGLAVPDDASTGLARTMVVDEPGFVESVSVSLEITGSPADGGWSGDLYVYLQHGPELVTLLNRPGRDIDRLAGYGDGSGFNVSFRDDAPNGDIHQYRFTLSGSHDTPLSGPLEGEWAPDSRATDPGMVLEGDARTLGLSQFNGLSADGTWTLFVADLSSGAPHQLENWSLTLAITPVPEPSEVGTAVAGVLALLALWRRLKVRQTGS